MKDQWLKAIVDKLKDLTYNNYMVATIVLVSNGALKTGTVVAK